MKYAKWKPNMEGGSSAKNLNDFWNHGSFNDSSLPAPGRSAWTVWNNPYPERKKVIIDGERFSDLEGFYREIGYVLCWTGDYRKQHNLSTFNELLMGGYGVFESFEPITFIWKNHLKSKKDLGIRTMNAWASGESFYDLITNIISKHDHIYLKLD